MLQYARRVIDRLGWTGPAMVEFMETPRGDYYCIEVNGRYWGSLPLAVDCGVPFPWLHYRQLRGETVSGPESYETDVRKRRLLFEDCWWLLDRLTRGDLRAVGPFLAAFLTADHTFVSAEDPLPTATSLTQIPRALLARVRDRTG